MQKWGTKLILLGIVTLCSILLITGPAMARTQFVSIGTGGTGGIYYPYGGGVAEIWSKHVKGVKAVAEVTGLEGYDLKRIMRTGTVATIDNRNWELRDQSGPVQRLSQSRAIALDMESATVAAGSITVAGSFSAKLTGPPDRPIVGAVLPMSTRVLMLGMSPFLVSRRSSASQAERYLVGFNPIWE